MPVLNIKISADAVDQEGNKVDFPEGFGLKHLGPRVQVTLFAPPIEGETGPPPVTGFAMIDTGASVTCVDRQLAENAGLAIVGEAPMMSATHDAEMVPLFAGNMRIEGLPDSNLTRAFGANLNNQGLLALIGRDLLASCVLVVNGLTGTVSLSI